MIEGDARDEGVLIRALGGLLPNGRGGVEIIRRDANQFVETEERNRFRLWHSSRCTTSISKPLELMSCSLSQASLLANRLAISSA